MLINNYKYFIALAEEKNISRAAEKLFISHQCLSKYLKTLEQHYHTTFFERTPQISITPAGEIMLDACRQIQMLEANLDSQLEDIRQSKRGMIRFGTTEGRYRILIPALLSRFKNVYPDVTLEVSCATSEKLIDSVLNNELDLVLINETPVDLSRLTKRRLLNEKLYLVISDNMLAKYFPDNYPKCKQVFRTKGADLTLFQHVPFILNKRGFNSRTAVDSFIEKNGIILNCVMELTQLDMHFMISAQDYAASFCWSMYIPKIESMNRTSRDNKLNIFPIRKLDTCNHIILLMKKGKILPEYGRVLIKMIESGCSAFTLS